MLRKLIPLLVLGLVLAPVAHAQTVDEVLAKHYEAEGGLDKLKALQSRRVTGTMMMGPGMEAPIVMEQKRPGKRRIEFTVQGMTGVQAFDGERAWSLLPFMGKTDPEYASEEDSKTERDDSDFDGPLVDWKAKGNTVELVGKEAVQGADAFKLKVTRKNGKLEYYYLDTETYLLVKLEGKTKRRGTEFDGESFFSDYKDVDGYMVPFVMEQGAKGMEQRQKMSFSKIEVNVPLDDSRFVMPGAAAVTDTSKTAKSAAADTSKAAKTAPKSTTATKSKKK
jgi:outer membrane lipoprotein-sorting protein